MKVQEARFPGYDVLSKAKGPSWNAATRRAIKKRLEPRGETLFFSAEEMKILEALCARILPQVEDEAVIVPLAMMVDEKMAKGRLDGFRHASMPPQGEAWRVGLSALDAEALEAFAVPFHQLAAASRDDLIGRMQRGELTADSWGGMPCRRFFTDRVIHDITHAYYSHPKAWSEIGFGGPASPRGYVRTALSRRDPWEASEATSAAPQAREAARRKNARVR
ncbi:MAG: gluconate 2-dehydrogenase subunit 3 family protein [Caulobacteraceae bacterium]